MFWTNVLLTLIVVLLVIVVVLVLRSSAIVPSRQSELPPVIVTLRDTTSARAQPPFDSGVNSEKSYGNTTMTYRATMAAAKPTAAESLSRYYAQAPKGIPTDYTMESCPCPFSKPQKTDVPMASLPLCTMLEQSSYKLSEFK